MPQREEKAGGDLRRDLGLLDAVGVGLGAIVGAGIFVVSGLAAGVAGPAFLVGLLLAGVAALCNALSSAQLAAAYPRSGGTYEYGYRLVHPWLGFEAGWMFLASKLAAGGTVALGFASYLQRLWPAVPLRPAAAAAVIALTIVNFFGVQKAGRLNTLIVGVTLLALLTFALAGIPAFRLSNLRPFAPRGALGALHAAALLFFAYTGYARIATLGEEVRDPGRTIPRAIVLSLGAALVLYLAVAFVAVGAVGAPALARTRSPLEVAAGALPLPGIRIVVAIGAVTAMLGVLLSQILGISRMMFAMARRSDLPAALGHVHSTYGAPDRGILLTGIILAALALLGTLQWIVAAASFTILVYYCLTNIAALRMKPEDRRFPPWVAALGLALCLLLALSLRPATIFFGLGLALIGIPVRLVFRAVNPPARSSES
jgi:APA family basic amino acid/polyamine antiporter